MYIFENGDKQQIAKTWWEEHKLFAEHLQSVGMFLTNSEEEISDADWINLATDVAHDLKITDFKSKYLLLNIRY